MRALVVKYAEAMTAAFEKSRWMTFTDGCSFQIMRCYLNRTRKGRAFISSQSNFAYEQIKEMILRMELLPGVRIPEAQIAAKLSLSRTPIHDALRRLESDGLVSIGHNRGAVVNCFTEAEIKEIGSIRLAQDILAAELASYYGNAADFEQLDQLAAACEEAATKGDVYGRIQTDENFHLAIARISGNSRLLNQQRALYQQVHLVQISKYTDIEQSLLQICHHRPIIAAIRSGDSDAIRCLVGQHIRDFYHIDSFVLRCYGG